MPQRVQVTGPDGKIEFCSLYNSYAEIAEDFRSGELKAGDMIIYRSRLCLCMADGEDIQLIVIA